jgi:integrase
MRKNGRKETTITDNIDRFIQVGKLITDINDPEQFKDGLSRIKWSNSTKQTTTSSYTVYLKTIGKTWTPPHYIRQEKIYFIPTEQEIDALINSSRVLAPLLQTLKETGMRIGEAYNVEWKDLDLDHKTVTVNHPEKGSLPRILPISQKCVDMIKTIPKDVLRPFARNVQLKGLKVTFDEARTRTAQRLANPRLKQIHFHTFRHWKATTDYYKTRDERMIRHILGHRTATMTDRYIHIVETIYHDETGEWTCKVAHTEKEAIELIEQGFTYVNNLGDTTALYRKRK